MSRERRGAPGLGFAIGSGVSAILWAVIAAIVYAVLY